MGTSARDDIDIGVGVHEIAGSSQIVDRLKTKLAELRAEAAKPVQSALKDSFRRELEALRENLGLEQSLIDEALAKRQTTETAAQRARLAAIERFAQEEVALRQRFGGVIPSPTPTVGTVQLGPLQAVSATLLTAQDGAENLSTKINVAIGAYQRMARQVNATDAVAVAAFRAEGDALAAYLLKLGATDAELNQIGSTIAKVERRAGANQIVPPIGAATLNSYNQVNPKLRTAANAVSLLGVNAVSGTGSLQGMALAAGNVAQGVAVLTTNIRVATAATGIGALVTIIATVVGLFVRWADESEKTQKSLENLGSLGPRIISQRLGDEAALAKTLEAQRADLNARLQKPFGENFGKLRTDLAKVDKQIEESAKRQHDLRVALIESLPAAEKDVAEQREQSENEAHLSALRRIQGETAAARESAKLKAKADIDAVKASGVAPVTQTRAIAAIELRRNAELLTIDANHARQVRDLRQKAADELLVIQTRELEGESAAQRTEIERQLARTVQTINDEVGLESVRGIRIAAARKDAADKIDKINKDQAQKARELSDEFAKAIASNSADVIPELNRAIADANRQRSEDQKKINAVDLGDAQATAVERFNLETEANARRDAAIEKAQREHGEALKRITDETENGILELTGKASQARRNVINAEFDDRVKAAKRLAAPPETITNLETQRGLALAKVDLDELEAAGTRAFEQLDQELKKTEALTVSGAITEREARERVIDAYRRTRATIAEILPALEAIAAKTGNQEAIDAVEQLKVKYIELGNTLNQVSNGLGRLKATLKDASTTALSGFLEGLAHLGGDTSEIKALTTHVESAQKELDALLATPSASRTAEQNTRITQLREEIDRTSQSLDASKRAIETWRDLFVNALKSVADALVKVSSEMLAQLIIQKIFARFQPKNEAKEMGESAIKLGIAGNVVLSAAGAITVAAAALKAAGQSIGGTSGGGLLSTVLGSFGGSDSGFSTANLFNQPEFATGGQVRGAKGRDAIAAWLTDEEYVISAPIVRRFGKDFFDLINFGGMLPPIIAPGHLRRYESGGFVEPLQRAPIATEQNRQEFVHHFRIHAPPGFTVEQIDSPKGSQVILTVLQKHGHTVRSLFGRGG